MRGVGVVAFSLLVASVSCTFGEYKPSCAVASIPGFQWTFVPATGAHLKTCDFADDKGEYLSLIGRAVPCRIGPMAVAPPSRWTSL